MYSNNDNRNSNIRLVNILAEKKLRITTAESCTGGMIASLLVDVPDASKVLESAIVSYSESAKTRYLGVSPDIIERFGVVSEEVAGLMAEGAAKSAGAECAISVTGVAGPSGGTKETPTGTVCFGFFICGKTETCTRRFDGGRNEVRTRAARFAIEKMTSLLN